LDIYPCGKTLGGSSSINGRIYLRETAVGRLATEVPNVALSGGPSAFVDHGRFAPTIPNFTVVVAGTHPRRRGTVWLQSANPLEPPHIDPRCFTESADLEDMKAGIRVVLEFAQREPVVGYMKTLVLSGEWPADDAILTEHIRCWSQTEYRPAGTCAMGVDEQAVVNAHRQQPERCCHHDRREGGLPNTS
jgi:choline dehydrogenase